MALFGVVPSEASRLSTARTGTEVDSAKPVTKISKTWNAKANMLNRPLYHPVKIVVTDPFGANRAAKRAVRMLSPTAST